jgi:hypothetical protein
MLCTARIVLAKSAVFPVLLFSCAFPVLLLVVDVVVVVDKPPADEPLLSVVVEPPLVDDEPLLSVEPPLVDDEPSLLSVVDEPSLLSVVDEPSLLSVCPLAYIIAEVGKNIEITIKNINEIVILFMNTSPVTYI